MTLKEYFHKAIDALCDPIKLNDFPTRTIEDSMNEAWRIKEEERQKRLQRRRQIDPFYTAMWTRPPTHKKSEEIDRELYQEKHKEILDKWAPIGDIKITKHALPAGDVSFLTEAQKAYVESITPPSPLY